MATTFQEELLASKQLPYGLRESFYKKMRQTVVVVQVKHTTGTTNWGGVVVGPEGLVVTAAHILIEEPEAIAYRCHNESKFYPAKVLYTDMGINLALLRRQVGENQPEVVHYVTLCPPDDIRVGKEAIAIGHPCNLVYTIAIGHVAYPAYGIGDPYEEISCVDKTFNKRRVYDCRVIVDEDLQHYSNELHVIQLHNIHGSKSSAGSAIFNSAGLLMGMEIFVYAKFDFCVHVSTLELFIKQGLEAEGRRGQSSQGLPAKKNIKYAHIEGNQKAKGPKGRVGSLTKLIMERGNMIPRNLSPLEDGIHTMGSKNWLKEMVDSHNGASAIVDLKERTVFDGGFMQTLSSSGKSVSTRKDQLDFDLESAPQNKKDLSFDKLVGVPLCDLSGQTSTTRTVKKLLLNPFSATATRKSLPLTSVERQGISLRDRILYDITNFSRLGIRKENINASNFTTQKETNLTVSETKLEVLQNPASKTSNSASGRKYALSSPSLKRKILEGSKTDAESFNLMKNVTEITTQRRDMLEVSPTTNKKLEVSAGVDSSLLFGPANPETYQGNVSMDSLANPNCVREMTSVPELVFPTLKENDGNVEKADACSKELDTVMALDLESASEYARICNMLGKIKRPRRTTMH